MNSIVKGLAVLGLLAASVAVAADFSQDGRQFRRVAQDCSPDGGINGGGGDVPGPFQSSNQKVELADGELYTLVGWIRIFDHVPYLEVDFDEHGWLASKTRKDEPFYQIEAAPDYWQRFVGKRMKTFVQARGHVMIQGNYGTYAITLFPMAEPVLLPRPQEQTGRR